MKSVSKRIQQYRVDKYFEENRSRLEYDSVIEHAPEIMAQTEAVFLFSLKLGGYSPEQIKKAHEEFIAVLNMPYDLMGKENTTNNVKEFMEREYGIDFSQISPRFPSYEAVLAYEEET